jgi:hypothetical protein
VSRCDFLGWLLAAGGLALLSEGYHAFRRWAARFERPRHAWWLAGAIWAVGLLAIKWGLAFQAACS